MRVLLYSFVVILIDQITKLYVKGISIPSFGINLKGMDYGSSISVIGDIFKITFVENPGMAFGISVGEVSKLFLSLFSLFASIGLLYYLYKIKNEKYVVRLAIALIFAGAVGNLIDRTFYGLIYGYGPVFYGKVVDFLNVEFFDFTIFGKTYDRWPIFNIADAAVTIGVALLIIFWRDPAKDKANVEAAAALENAEIPVTETPTELIADKFDTPEEEEVKSSDDVNAKITENSNTDTDGNSADSTKSNESK